MSFWQGKRVLITGGSGFVGSHLVARLKGLGAMVVCLSYRHSSEVGVEHLLVDVTDRAQVTRALAAYRVELCYHLAAQAIGSIARQDPVGTLETNVRGTWNVIDACRILDIPVCISSSDKSFGSSPPPFTEETPMEPAGPYEVSKACADLIARSYARTYEMPIAIARPSNIYGEGDLNFTRIIPYAISQALRGEPTTFWGDGTDTRDYLYVQDMIDGYVALGDYLYQGRKSTVLNFGTGKPTNLLELVASIGKLVGKPVKPILKRQKTGEVKDQWVDASKASLILGWQAKTPLIVGLEKALLWYKGYLGYA